MAMTRRTQLVYAHDMPSFIRDLSDTDRIEAMAVCEIEGPIFGISETVRYLVVLRHEPE